jgi:D-arabinose 1-dehydrogenase-like Zn-dependent alcohol dehydrogenase
LRWSACQESAACATSGCNYANKLGYRVVAIAEKAALATELDAHHYIDSTSVDPRAALQYLGVAAAIIVTAASGASMSPLVAGLAPRGQLVVVGAAFDAIEAAIGGSGRHANDRILHEMNQCPLPLP